MIPFTFDLRKNGIQTRRVIVKAKDKLEAFAKVNNEIVELGEDIYLLSEWDLLLEKLVEEDLIWLVLGSIISADDKEPIEDRLMYLRCLSNTDRDILNISEQDKQKIYDYIDKSIKLLENEENNENI
jgi:hypothetical protein